MTDFAYICPGSCQAAVVRPQVCGDERCNMAGRPLRRVPVVFTCQACQRESPVPANHEAGCKGGLHLLAKAVVPPDMQFPMLNPPEGNRSYSSIYDNNAVGTGHARSMIGSEQAWSALENNLEQWMIIDSGYVVDSIAGLVVSNRGDGYHNQIVTRIAVDVAVENDVWVQVGTFTTNIVESTRGFLPVHFPTPVVAQYVRVRPLEWQAHISIRCGLILAGDARQAFTISPRPAEHRLIVDVNQLPAQVPLSYIPGGTPPPPHALAVRGPYDIIQVPTGEWEWEGRTMRFRILSFNGHVSTQSNDNRVVAVRPGQECSIAVEYWAQWDYNPNDYCPGCIVQLYYGMQDVFSQGVVQYGIHNHHGTNQVNFVAPTTPGLYYITPSISLDYHYVPQHHRNSPDGAIAAVRVLPTVFEESVLRMLPGHWQDQFTTLLSLSNKSGENGNIFSGIPREVMYEIFTYLMSLNNIPAC